MIFFEMIPANLDDGDTVAAIASFGGKHSCRASGKSRRSSALAQLFVRAIPRTVKFFT